MEEPEQFTFVEQRTYEGPIRQVSTLDDIWIIGNDKITRLELILKPLLYVLSRHNRFKEVGSDVAGHCHNLSPRVEEHLAISHTAAI
jgi:hypothetical protein